MAVLRLKGSGENGGHGRIDAALRLKPRCVLREGEKVKEASDAG